MLNSKLDNALARINNKLSSEGISDSSAFGIWSLAAYLTNSYPNDVPAEVAELVGMSKTESLDVMRRLMATKPEVVSFALSSWAGTMTSNIEHLFGKTSEIAKNVPALPNQEEMDLWACEESFGLFPQFPVDVTQFDSIFSSVIAAKIQWAEKFTIVPNTLSHWKVDNILHANKADVRFFRHEENRYVVLRKSNEGDELSVFTVLPLDSEENLDKIAYSYANGDSHFESIHPDEALMDGVVSVVRKSQKNTFNVSLPAWEANSHFSVSAILPEFKEIAKNLNPAMLSETVQFVKASYNAVGFEAAAITSVLMRAMVSMPTQNTYQIDFNRNHHVIAVGQFDNEEIPLFSFAVTSAVEATED